MINKLTEDELLLIENLCDPTAATEIIFSNLDNLGEQIDNKFSHVRMGQLTMQSFEYLLDEDPELTLKQNFSLQEGAGTIYNQGGRNFGKCEWTNNLCQLANGNKKTFGDLIGTTQEVVSLNQETYKLEKAEATFYKNGNKPCYEIVLDSGKNIIVTENHPLLTDNGWIMAENLSLTNWIATPCEYKNLGLIKAKKYIPELLGYLLGDGSCTHQIGFTNVCKELISEFYQITKFFNCEIRNQGFTYYVKSPGSKKNNIDILTKKYKINTLSKNKTIPEEVFLWRNKDIATLLNRLYACDGHVNLHNFTIEMTLASKEMIKQIQSLLIRFGIHSYYSYKESRCNDKSFDAWRLTIGTDFDKFLDTIGIKSKDKGIRQKSDYSTSNRIPNSFIKKEYDTFKQKKKLNLRKLKVYNPSKRNCQRVAIATENKEFIKQSFSDIYWEQIKEINFIGMFPTVVVSVPGNENYVSNDIISHNSLIGLIVDECLSLIHHEGWDMGFSSYDEPHIYGVQDKVSAAMTYNPFLALFNRKISKHPTYVISSKNGAFIEAINMRIKSSKEEQQGEGFFQKHHKKRFVDENSFMTQKVYDKKVDSVHELGCIERESGMTNMTKYSPAGKIFNDPDMRGFVLNLPQFINPTWDEKSMKRAIKKYGGKQSTGYKIFVEGKIVEDGESALDMERVRECYLENKEVKFFEMDKSTYNDWKNQLDLFFSVDRPVTAERIWISADIGLSAPTEICVFSEMKGKYKWIYNIVLRQLTDKEQFFVFKCLANKLKANFVGLDCTDGSGKSIYGRLAEIFPKQNLCWVSFNEKMPTVPETDENGKVIIKDGKVVYREDYVINWAFQRLKELLYSQKFEIPLNHKFNEQFNSVIIVRSKTRVLPQCIAVEDHLWSSFQVFAVMQWMNELILTKPVHNKKRAKSGV